MAFNKDFNNYYYTYKHPENLSGSLDFRLLPKYTNNIESSDTLPLKENSSHLTPKGKYTPDSFSDLSQYNVNLYIPQYHYKNSAYSPYSVRNHIAIQDCCRRLTNSISPKSQKSMSFHSNFHLPVDSVSYLPAASYNYLQQFYPTSSVYYSAGKSKSSTEFSVIPPTNLHFFNMNSEQDPFSLPHNQNNDTNSISLPSSFQSNDESTSSNSLTRDTHYTYPTQEQTNSSAKIFSDGVSIQPSIDPTQTNVPYCNIFSTDSLMIMKLTSLKSIAQKLGLKYCGNKATLVERLVNFSKTQNTINLEMSTEILNPTASSVKPKKGSRKKKVTSTLSAKPIISYNNLAKRNSKSQSDVNQNQTILDSIETVSGLPQIDYPFQIVCKTSHNFRSCLCRGNSNHMPETANSYVLCVQCNIVLHKNCMFKDPNASLDTKDFLCPLCKLKNMDPFFPTERLLWFTYLDPSISDGSVKTKDGYYVMTSVCSLSLPNLRHIRKDNKEVVIRCINLNSKTKNNQPVIQHEWPHTLHIKINSHLETIQAQKLDHKRRDSPMIITTYLKSTTNMIIFSATQLINSAKNEYAVGIFLCESVSIDRMIKRITETAKESYSESLDRVKNIVNTKYGDDDDDVTCMEETHKFKITCPITLTIISTPVRGRHCKHLQCYDLESYLCVTKNSKAFNTRWKCPECTNIVYPDNIMIDGYVMDVLKKVKHGNVIQVFSNAEWKVISSTFSCDSSYENTNNDQNVNASLDKNSMLISNSWGIFRSVEVEDIDDEYSSSESDSHKNLEQNCIYNITAPEYQTNLNEPIANPLNSSSESSDVPENTQLSANDHKVDSYIDPLKNKDNLAISTNSYNVLEFRNVQESVSNIDLLPYNTTDLNTYTVAEEEYYQSVESHFEKNTHFRKVNPPTLPIINPICIDISSSSPSSSSELNSNSPLSSSEIFDNLTVLTQKSCNGTSPNDEISHHKTNKNYLSSTCSSYEKNFRRKSYDDDDNDTNLNMSNSKKKHLNGPMQYKKQKQIIFPKSSNRKHTHTNSCQYYLENCPIDLAIKI